MSFDQLEDIHEQSGNGTPSTASRVKPVAVENAFPTPPRRDPSGASEPQKSGLQSPVAARLFGLGKMSPALKEHKSAEVLRSQVIRGHVLGYPTANELEKVSGRKDISKKNSQYFDQSFAVRESYYSAKERVTRDSVMIVEIRLNCCLEREQGFLNDLLMTMSEIYHKPTQNIMIVATTDASILISGSTEPAYLISLTALPSEIASMKNLRATTMVQEFVAESLKIPANRGVVKFQSVKEDEVGTNGITIRDEIDRIETEERRGFSLRSRQSTRTKRGSTMPSMSEAFGVMEHSRSNTPMLSHDSELNEDGEDKEKPTRSVTSAGKMMRGKKSIMSFWKRN